MELEEVHEASLRGKLLHVAWGTSLHIKSSGLDGSLKSRLIGMDPDEFLILHIPSIPGILNRLYEGNLLTVRYMYSGVIYGFNSTVLCYTAKPALLVFISYPKTIEVLNLRKMHRVDCLFPAAAKFEEKEYRGVMLDISSGGCKFAIEALDDLEPSSIRVGVCATISFLLPGIVGTQIARGIVRNLRQESERVEVGMEFDASNTNVIRDIEIYVKNVLELHHVPSL